MRTNLGSSSAVPDSHLMVVSMPSLVLRFGPRRYPYAQPQHARWEYVQPLPVVPWPSDIPRQIHISCVASDDVLRSPARIVPFWQALNPEFVVLVHNHSESREFLMREYPAEVVSRYDAVPQWAHRVRSDLWRVAFLLKHGGVYVDSDVEPIVGLQQMITSSDRFVTSLSSVANMLNPHFIVARPGEPILKATLDKMVAGLQWVRRDTPTNLNKYMSWTVCSVLYQVLLQRWNVTRLARSRGPLGAAAFIDGVEQGVRLFGEGKLVTFNEENHLRKVMAAPPDRVLLYTKYLTDSDNGKWYPSADGMRMRRHICPNECVPDVKGPNCSRQAWRQGSGMTGYTVRGCSDGNWSLPRCLLHSKRRDCLT